MKGYVAVGIFFVVGAIFCFLFQISFCMNFSESMPKGVYLTIGVWKNPYIKNTNIVFCPRPHDYDLFLDRNYISKNISGKCFKKYPPFIKKVIASYGDFVQIKNNEVYLNGTLVKNSKILSVDRNHKALPRLENGFEKILSKDEFFVFGDGKDSIHSLDSRYIGLVRGKEIVGSSYLVWGFS